MKVFIRLNRYIYTFKNIDCVYTSKAVKENASRLIHIFKHFKCYNFSLSLKVTLVAASAAIWLLMTSQYIRDIVRAVSLSALMY